MNKYTEPRILSGFMELLPEDQIVFDNMKNIIEETYKEYGFLPMDNPVIELSEVLLAKAGGETEKQIYRFNKGDNDLSLRFDLTVPLARYVSMNYPNLVFPFKRYAIGKVYRGERPQKGRYREFYQCDIDVIGSEKVDLMYDAEVPTIIYNIFKKFGFSNFTINLNNRKVLKGFFNNLNISEEDSVEVLRIIDKMPKIGKDNVVSMLKDYNISEKSINEIISFVEIDGNYKDVISKIRSLNIDNEIFTEGVNELEFVCDNMYKLGVPYENYKINLTITRGLDYYTGTVYETFLNDYMSIGSVSSGGRYDSLTKYYTDKSFPGVGMSIGLTRLYSKFKELSIIETNKKCTSDVMVLSLGEDDAAFALATKLRKDGIKVDMCYIAKGMKQKMQYASRLMIPYVILLGEDEVKNNLVALKNMNTGEQVSMSYEETLKILKSK
jgi:histidyl-tRNA synthetase